MLPHPFKSNLAPSRHPCPARTPERRDAVTRRIVAIGGGTGLPAVLEGLCRLNSDGRPHDRDAVTAVVTMTDDGGSSGRLRETFGMVPPGDVRNCLAAAAHTTSPLRDLLQHRFSSGGEFEGHSVGNLLLTALTQMTGDFPTAIDALGELVGSRARVLPSTAANVRLTAQMDSGRVICGETAIVSARERIRKLSIAPRCRPLPEVLRALVNADGIVIGPGSLYTSVLPVLLVEGVASTIAAVKAVRIYVANLMTEPGETDDYTLDDHLRVIHAHAGFELFDYILVNRSSMNPAVVADYETRGARPVPREHSLRYAGHGRVIECDLTTEYTGRKIRHSPSSLATAIRCLVERGRPESSFAHCHR